VHRLCRTSLASRIVLATVSVALLAAVATAVVAFQLVRQVTIEQSREVLRSTTRVVAATPAKERATIVRNLDRADAGRIHLVLVRATGATVPLGDTTVPASALARVESTGRVSERVTSGGTTLLIEGTKLSAGDTVIATQNFSLVQSATARLLWRFALATGLGLVVAVGVGILVARLVTRPLRGAARSARLLAAGRRGVIPSAATEGVAEIVDI
jgi:two-component system, OmpR family, sensor kinase